MTSCEKAALAVIPIAACILKISNQDLTENLDVATETAITPLRTLNCPFRAIILLVLRNGPIDYGSFIRFIRD